MSMLYESGQSRRITYFYHPDVSAFYYGSEHPMKPHRIAMAHSLISNYGLYESMEIIRPVAAPVSLLTLFHSPDYVEAIKLADPLIAKSDSAFSEYYSQKKYESSSPLSAISASDNKSHDKSAFLQRFSIGSTSDCPSFPGVFEYSCISAGSSLGAAVRLATQRTEIAISWIGGLHHAKKREASGFCYVNDIVLAILELLRSFKRVLYIDIDVHHGDGVEEAFYNTDRVFTLSFHRFGDFFPGTGNLNDVGMGKGKFFSANVPLNVGLSDKNFVENGLFKNVTCKVVEKYKPEAIVLQCGADSVAGDLIGQFNLSSKAHGEAVRIVKQFGLPLMVLGGGGYTVKNVSRTWAYETSVLCGIDVGNDIPSHEYSHCYAPDFKLNIESKEMEDLNKDEEIEQKVKVVVENLRAMESSPALNM